MLGNFLEDRKQVTSALTGVSSAINGVRQSIESFERALERLTTLTANQNATLDTINNSLANLDRRVCGSSEYIYEHFTNVRCFHH